MKSFDSKFLSRLPGLFRLAAVLLGGLHTWAAVQSQSMNADGISYLDIGDAYMRGDWSAALNPVWSPMYSWILGPVTHLFKPSIEWEFPLVQIVNFFIYLFALVCFEFFWRRVIARQQTAPDAAAPEKLTTLPGWAWWPIGYLIFIYCSLNLIEIWAVTPDILMSGFVYLAAGIMMDIRLKGASYERYVRFGTLLGLAYLAKAVMFPLAFLFLGASLFMAGGIRRAVPMVLAAAVSFFLLSAPFIAMVSYSRGELKFGDAGKLTYLRYIAGLPYPHWQGDPPGSGVPQHPSRKIFDHPPVYEFATPVAGTYPISYDPSYWYEGAAYRFNPAKQLSYLIYSLRYYLDLFFREQAGLTVGTILLYLFSRYRQLSFLGIIGHWGLLIPALGAFGFYGIVHVIGRYIGMFALLIWGELLSNIRLPDTVQIRKTAAYLSAVMIALMVISIGIFNIEGMLDLIGGRNPHQQAIAGAPGPARATTVARELQHLGVKPGERVGVIGYAFGSFWARLARVQIAAEMLESDAKTFWLGDRLLQSNTLAAFAGSGVKAVIAEQVPPYADLSDWRKIGNSGTYVYRFDRSRNMSPNNSASNE